MPEVIVRQMEEAAREREAKEKGTAEAAEDTTTPADADSPLEAAVIAKVNDNEAAAMATAEERMI